MRINKIVADRLVERACTRLLPMMASRAAQAAVRLAVLDLAAHDDDNDGLQWGRIGAACNRIGSQGGMKFAASLSDRVVYRFVQGKHQSANAESISAVLLLVVFERLEADPKRARRPGMATAFSLGTTFAEAERILNEVVNEPANGPANGQSITRSTMESEWSANTAVAIRSLHDVLRGTRGAGASARILFTKAEDRELEDYSYYMLYRRSTRMPDAMTGGFLAIRKVFVDGKPSCVFTHIAARAGSSVGRITRGGVITMERAVYFLGGVSNTDHAWQPDRKAAKVDAAAISAFTMHVDEIEHERVAPTGVFLSNNQRWSPIVGRFCAVHLGFASDLVPGGILTHHDVGIDVMALGSSSGPSPFAAHLAALDARYRLSRRMHVDPLDLESEIVARVDGAHRG